MRNKQIILYMYRNNNINGRFITLSFWVGEWYIYRYTQIRQEGADMNYRAVDLAEYLVKKCDEDRNPISNLQLHNMSF